MRALVQLRNSVLRNLLRVRVGAQNFCSLLERTQKIVNSRRRNCLFIHTHTQIFAKVFTLFQEGGGEFFQWCRFHFLVPRHKTCTRANRPADCVPLYIRTLKAQNVTVPTDFKPAAVCNFFFHPDVGMGTENSSSSKAFPPPPKSQFEHCATGLNKTPKDK